MCDNNKMYFVAATEISCNPGPKYSLNEQNICITTEGFHILKQNNNVGSSPIPQTESISFDGITKQLISISGNNVVISKKPYTQINEK